LSANDVTEIREYLLRALDEEARQKIEERILLDREFLEQVMVAEDELIDEYLAGNLPEEERFESYFLSAPRQRQKVSIARALRQYAAESEPEAASEASGQGRQPSSWLGRVLTAIRARRARTAAAA
jgi:hypothetical protein